MVAGVPTRAALPILGAASGLYVFAGTRLGCVIDGNKYWALADDQLISLRYARNLARGHGLVWNPGEAPVEGISNLLWTLWMALGHAVGIPYTHVSLWVVAASIVSLLACAVFAAKLATKVAPGHAWAPAAAMAGAAFYWPTVRWAAVGFEVGALAAVTCVAAWYTIVASEPATSSSHPAGSIPDARKKALLKVGLWGVVGLALRLDMAVIIGALGLCLLLRAEDRAARRQVWLRVAGPCALALLIMTAWRYAYYGELVPNTFVLKGTGVDLWTRVKQGATAFNNTVHDHLALLLLPAILAFAGPDEGRRARNTLAAIAVAQYAFLLYIGGDTWEEEHFANRQISTVVPALMALIGSGFVLLFSWLADAFAPPRARRKAALVTGVFAAFSWWISSARNAVDWARFDHCQSLLWPKVELAVHLEKVAPPDTRVAVVWAGAVPYFSDLPAIDLLGKSDPVIARTKPHHSFAGHNKWDYSYSIGKLQPHMVIDLYDAKPADLKAIAKYGYRFMPDGIWYRKDFSLPPLHPTPPPAKASFAEFGASAAGEAKPSLDEPSTAATPAARDLPSEVD